MEAAGREDENSRDSAGSRRSTRLQDKKDKGANEGKCFEAYGTKI